MDIYTQYELNLACLRTIVKLLDRLQFTSPEPANNDDIVHTASRLFNKYSSVLLNGFDYCQVELPVSQGLLFLRTRLTFVLKTSDSVSEIGSIQMVRSLIMEKECVLIAPFVENAQLQPRDRVERTHHNWPLSSGQCQY